MFQELRQHKSQRTSLVKRRILNYLIALESTLLIALTVVAVRLRDVGEVVTPYASGSVLILLIAFPIIWLTCLSLYGAWDVAILENHIDGYRRLLKSSLVTFLAFSSASYIFKIQISRFVILISLICGTIIHLILRWVFLRIVDSRVEEPEFQERWLVISERAQSTPVVEEFLEQFDSEISYFEIFSKETEFLPWIDDLIFEIESSQSSGLVLTSVQGFSHAQIEHLTWKVQQSNTKVVIQDPLGFVTSQNQVKHYSDFNWLQILTPHINDSHRVLKRVFDLLLVTPSLIVLSPIFLIIAIALKWDSRGNILYIQKRIGQDGKIIVFPKFRTMFQGSDSNRLETLGRPDEKMPERYRNDPRITRVGKVLRRYSLDELPQLWCVFIGTMSLVGPRPILPEEEVQLEEPHFKRHIAKPGLTGIWQVSGRKDTTWEERMAFDLRYVQEWSLALDLILIARTFRAIASGTGSY
jgi:exopolysaccharide biosynthesis polyprenyl glycosylphosphotransferase